MQPCFLALFAAAAMKVSWSCETTLAITCCQPECRTEWYFCTMEYHRVGNRGRKCPLTLLLKNRCERNVLCAASCGGSSLCDSVLCWAHLVHARLQNGGTRPALEWLQIVRPGIPRTSHHQHQDSGSMGSRHDCIAHVMLQSSFPTTLLGNVWRTRFHLGHCKDSLRCKVGFSSTLLLWQVTDHVAWCTFMSLSM
jgi:hypothetical protein